jgi:hypothetical protein
MVEKTQGGPRAACGSSAPPLPLFLSLSLPTSIALSLANCFYISLPISIFLSLSRCLSLSHTRTNYHAHALALSLAVTLLRPSRAVRYPHSGHFRAEKEQIKRGLSLSPVSQGQNLALTVLYVPYSLDSGTQELVECSARGKSKGPSVQEYLAHKTPRPLRTPGLCLGPYGSLQGGSGLF